MRPLLRPTGPARLSHHVVARFRVGLAAGFVLLLASGAGAFFDTHLNEITADALDYAGTRVAALDGQPSLTKDEKKERGKLRKLAKKLRKNAGRLKVDMSELAAAAKTADKLGDAGLPMRDALDDGFARAELALGERREFVGDHLEFVTPRKIIDKVNKFLTKAAGARASANAAETDTLRAKFLKKEEKLLTKALSRAEKTAKKDNPGLVVPPRLRSGDLIGIAGARVAIPADAGTPLAGSSVVIPSGALQLPTVITIGEGTDFVGGRDTPAGPALGLGPAGLELQAAARVFVPFTRPDGAELNQIALFHDDGNEITSTLNVTFDTTETFLSGETRSFSSFQAGVLAPPLGAPGGQYHVQMFAVSHTLDDQDEDKSEERFGIFEQDLTFRADGSGFASAGSVPLAFRAVRSTAPHHIDGFQTSVAGSYDFAWQQLDPPLDQGRFTFTFPLGLNVGEADGVVSTDANVIAFSGRGGTLEFFGVGVRTATAAVAADLAGRWQAVEIGAELFDDFAEPFTTRYFSSLTSFVGDADDLELTFDAGGTSFYTDRTFNTHQVPPNHARDTGQIADGGVEDYSVLFNGEVRGDGLRRRGFVQPDAGVFISAHRDSSAKRLGLMIAVRQPAGGAPVAAGIYNLVRLDLGAIVRSPITTESDLEVDPAVGSLVVSGGEASLVIDPFDRGTYTLRGLAPLADMTWSSSVALTQQSPSSLPFTFTLDADGNFAPANTERWYAVSGDGNFVLGATPGEVAREVRGIAIGLK